MRKQRETTVLYCQACSRKFILDDTVTEIKVNDVPGGIPYIDKDDGKVKVPPMMPRRKMFRCPGCGRGVASKLLTTPSQEHKVLYEGDFRNPGSPR